MHGEDETEAAGSTGRWRLLLSFAAIGVIGLAALTVAMLGGWFDDGTSAGDTQDAAPFEDAGAEGADDAEQPDADPDDDDAQPAGRDALGVDDVEHGLLIWLCDDVDCPLEDHHLDVLEALVDDPDVIAHRLADPVESYEQLTQVAPSAAELLDPDDLPMSIRAALAPGSDPEAVADRYRGRPGVDEVIVRNLRPRDEPEQDEEHETRFVAIFLCDDRACPPISDEQSEMLLAAIEADDDVLDVHYETKQEAYDNYVEQYADQPHLIEAITPETLPPSYRLTLTDDADLGEVVSRYEPFEGVDAVVPQYPQS